MFNERVPIVSNMPLVPAHGAGLCRRNEQITGQYPSNYQDGMQILRNVGAQRVHGYQVLYNVIEKLQSELDETQQILTCLGYRHVLEMLPNKDSIDFQNHSDDPTNGRLSATSAWNMIWDIAVQEQLLKMIQLYNNARATGTVAPAAPPAVPPTTAATSPQLVTLEQLLQHDFDFQTVKWSNPGAGRIRQKMPALLPPLTTLSNLHTALEDLPYTIS